ncbi:hypothetical protein LINPERHAP1_LOCUS36604, partial [Linum perenne]
LHQSITPSSTIFVAPLINQPPAAITAIHAVRFSQSATTRLDLFHLCRYFLFHKLERSIYQRWLLLNKEI